MEKVAKTKIKLQIEAGKATPAPPVGTVLGPTGINMGEFCTQFNDATKDRMGEIIPIVLSIYEDRSFSFITKTSPASFLICRAAGIKAGSGKNLIKKVGSITEKQVEEIAKEKLEDLNARNIEAAKKIIRGTAQSMGVKVNA